MNMMAVRNGGEQEVNKYYYRGQSLLSSAHNGL
jgi:hypothetical protein